MIQNDECESAGVFLEEATEHGVQVADLTTDPNGGTVRAFVDGASSLLLLGETDPPEETKAYFEVSVTAVVEEAAVSTELGKVVAVLRFRKNAPQVAKWFITAARRRGIRVVVTISRSEAQDVDMKSLHAALPEEHLVVLHSSGTGLSAWFDVHNTARDLAVVCGGAEGILDDITACTSARKKAQLIVLHGSGGVTNMWRDLWYHNVADGIELPKLLEHLAAHGCPQDRAAQVNTIVRSGCLMVRSVSLDTHSLRRFVDLVVSGQDDAAAQALKARRRYRKTARAYGTWRSLLYFFGALLTWASTVLALISGESHQNVNKGDALFWLVILLPLLLTMVHFIESNFGLHLVTDAASRAAGLVEKELACYCTRTQHYSDKALAEVMHLNGTDVVVVRQDLLYTQLDSIRNTFDKTDALISSGGKAYGCVDSAWNVLAALFCCSCNTPHAGYTSLKDLEDEPLDAEGVAQLALFKKEHYARRIRSERARIHRLQVVYFYVTFFGGLLGCAAGAIGTILTTLDYSDWVVVTVAVNATVTKLTSEFRVNEMRMACAKAVGALEEQSRRLDDDDFDSVVGAAEEAIESVLPPTRKATKDMKTKTKTKTNDLC